jgi:hypothetical protein
MPLTNDTQQPNKNKRHRTLPKRYANRQIFPAFPGEAYRSEATSGMLAPYQSIS